MMDIEPVFQHINGLEVVYDAPDEPVIFLGSEAGLFFSRDDGSSWVNTLAVSGLESTAMVTALKAQRLGNVQTLLLAGTYGGLYRSASLGATWEVVSFGRPAPVITAFCATQENILHAATLNDGVYTSTDQGLHWIRWNFGLLDWHVYALSSANLADGSVILLAGTESGIYASKNHGRTWRETPFPDNCGTVLALSAAQDGTVLYAGTETGVIYCSLDSGATWSVAYSDPDEPEVTSLYTGASAEGQGVCAAACGSRIIATCDAGQTWQVWYSAAPGSTITTFCAPLGLRRGAPLWGALDDGSIFQVEIA